MSDNRKGKGTFRGEKVVEELAQPPRGALMLAKFVVDALAKKQQGDAGDYQAAVEQLSASQMKPVAMQRWLQALKLSVSHLTEEFDLLVGATLRFTWYDKDPDVVKLYVDYLTHLISAHTYYLKSALLVLVKTLWIPTTEGEGVYHNIHEAIQAILHIVPTAPSVLMPLLSKNYPFKGKSANIQELAVRNVLHITTYCPTLRHDILQLVVHQMLTIDVEVPRLEEEEEAEEEDEEGGGGIGKENEEMQFHVELESCSPDVTRSNGGCHGNDRHSLTACYSQQQLMANEAAEKLDVMMTVVFHYLHSICHQRGVFVLDSAARLLQSLLKIFEQVVLPTHACSHIQFLLFDLTSLNKAFPVCFLDFLWEKFQCPSTPSAIRQTLAAYLASYIARAKFVTLATAKLCLTMMVQWLHQYIDECSPEHMRPDVKKHGPFYSLCQAVFYVFIFRHKALLEMEGGISFLRQMNLERLISCRLNPLKVCLSTVVEMFASLTSCHEIVFCYTILEQNKRLILSTPISPRLPSSQGPTAAPHPSDTNLLDSFFPFDPYCLKRSAKFVHPHYQEWEEIRGEEMEEDDRSSVSPSFQSGHYPRSMDSSFSPPLPQNCSFSPH